MWRYGRRFRKAFTQFFFSYYIFFVRDLIPKLLHFLHVFIMKFTRGLWWHRKDNFKNSIIFRKRKHVGHTNPYIKYNISKKLLNVANVIPKFNIQANQNLDIRGTKRWTTSFHRPECLCNPAKKYISISNHFQIFTTRNNNNKVSIDHTCLKSVKIKLNFCHLIHVLTVTSIVPQVCLIIFYTNHVLTSGTSIALRVRPDRMLKGRGANSRAIPLAVWSEYRGVSLRKGST